MEWLAEITWFGHSAFKIEMANRIVLVDPWLDESPSSPVKSLDITRADVVHMTYDHTDHLGDALSVCRRTSAMLAKIVREETLNAKAVALMPGETYAF